MANASETKDKEATAAEDALASGPLTMEDVEALAERSAFPPEVIDVLTERVTARTEGRPSRFQTAAERAAEEEGSADEGDGESEQPSAADPEPEGVRATKGAEKLAQKMKVNLAEVKGSGHEGSDGKRKVTKGDVERHLDDS